MKISTLALAVIALLGCSKKKPPIVGTWQDSTGAAGTFECSSEQHCTLDHRGNEWTKVVIPSKENP